MRLLKGAGRKISGKTARELVREMKWLLARCYKYRYKMLWYAAAGLVSTVLGLIGSVVSKYIIDAVTGYDSTRLIQAAVFYVLSQAVSILLNAAASRISAGISISVEQEMRAELYDHVLKADWQALSRFHSGDLLTRIEGDAGTAAGSVLTWIPNLVNRLVSFAGAFFIIFAYDKTMAFLALLSAPLSLLLSRIVLPRMRRYNEEIRRVNAEMMIFKEESFHNVESLKSLGLVRLYGERFREVQRNYREKRMEYNLFSIGTQMLMSGGTMLVGAACFGWGVYRLWSGAITYGTMTLFLQMSSSLSSSFSALASMVPSLISTATAVGRVMEVTELPKERDEDGEAAEELVRENPEGLKAVFSDVSFSYSDARKVFEKVNIEAEPGRIIGLIGPSGGGKTTFMRLLLGLIEPREGEILLKGAGNGRRIRVSASTRKLFSYVPQGSAMFAGTVAENLRLLDEHADDEKLIRVLRQAAAYDFIAAKPDGLNTPIRERGGGFSEGQIQRLSIARALLARAPILLLDEATSALDPETERQVLKGILSYDPTRTVIVTTHRPSVLASCDAVYRIEGGGITRVSAAEAMRSMEVNRENEELL
ncbi:MAG: ABC transporter ATP-binding protein/permease [Lachnospiraceae bacterium]|nr:ABC transporter ATP-binding protein/permease [Lachnospiraceae bacterium]